MNLIFSRTLKALCTVVIAGSLAACGSSSTYQPFVPTRVVGLGDGYNVSSATVVEAGSTTGTVVGQVAAYFGQSNVVNPSATGAKISALAGQIDDVVTNHGGFSSGDLVVIAVGTHDVIGNDQVNGTAPITATQAEAAATALFVQVQRLQDLGVKHTLIMPVLEVSRTPWGRAKNFSTSATTILNDKVLGKVPSGYNQNPVIYANASSVTSQFLLATSTNVYSTFTDTGVDASGVATTPACGAASVTAMTGCDAVVNSAPNPAVNTSYGTMLFADGLHLTPAGNRWVAQFLFSATSNGWR